MGTLDGRVVLITGAAHGIGLATARAAVGAGAAGVVLADLDGDAAAVAATDLASNATRTLGLAVDVADGAAVATMVERTVAEFGRLDAAFNNAGIESDPAPTADCTEENFARTIAVNLTGVFLCMKHEIPVMLGQGGGSIVNNSSVAGLVGFPGLPSYVASKHGVVGLTRAAALEYATAGIRANAVCPGVIATDMITRFTHDDPAQLATLSAQEPIGRLGEPREVADAVLWLWSDQSSFVTGQAIAVDGGMTVD